ncbi:helix-turn-helix domain-containing protein [Sorangium sp. So ce385]
MRKNPVPPPPLCPLTVCMALLRGAWAPNVLWSLSGQPRRFGELRVDIPQISARVLSARLRELEAKGVVSRRVMPTSPPSVEYELTQLGQELVPALRSIVEVGRKLNVRGPHSVPGPGARARRRSAGRPEAPGQPATGR